MSKAFNNIEFINDDFQFENHTSKPNVAELEVLDE
jgi:hypothetical protein